MTPADWLKGRQHGGCNEKRPCQKRVCKTHKAVECRDPADGYIADQIPSNRRKQCLQNDSTNGDDLRADIVGVEVGEE